MVVVEFITLVILVVLLCNYDLIVEILRNVNGEIRQIEGSLRSCYDSFQLLIRYRLLVHMLIRD